MGKKLRKRNSHLKYKYNVTLFEMKQLFAKQEAKCAICAVNIEFLDKPCLNGGIRNKHEAHIEHDHKTGRVRGMVCFSCNVSIGHMNDDPARLYSMIRYLENQNEPD